MSTKKPWNVIDINFPTYMVLMVFWVGQLWDWDVNRKVFAHKEEEKQEDKQEEKVEEEEKEEENCFFAN